MADVRPHPSDGTVAQETATSLLGPPERLQGLPTVSFSALRLFLDVLALAAAVGLAFLVRFHFEWLAVREGQPVGFGTHVVVAVLWSLAFLGIAAVNRLYDEDTLFPGGGEIPRVFRTCLEAVAVLSVFVFFTHALTISRAWFGLTAVTTLLGTIVGRLALRRHVRRARDHGRLRRSAILVSDDPKGWSDDLLRDVPEFEATGILDGEQAIAFLREVRGNPDLSAVRKRVGTLIVHARGLPEEDLWELVLEAGLSNFSVFVHSDVRSVGRGRLTVREVGRHTIVKIAPPKLTGFEMAQKRVFDLLVGTVLLILLSPVLLIISVLVLITSGWPVFFVQDRTGKDGTTFRMLKFRTMYRDAERGTGPVRAIKDDPRRTPFGRFLRRTSLDELPQLINVLRGEMSLVGPRPEMAPIAHDFIETMPWYQYRHRIRPGITGWAQAHGLRGDTSISSRVDFDNWYIEHWSLALDVRILLRTLKELSRGENAY
jgi:exopolysaccharide biosynthesis polyprenyl glycosylphosphotransferase